MSVAIMAHPSRRKFVDELFLCLDEPATVIWDHHNDRWETGARALLSYNPNDRYHMVIQDDAIPCRDLVRGAMRAAETAGERPISCYIGKTRPHRNTVTPAVQAALDAGATFFEHEGPWWGVAVVLPTAHCEPIVEYIAGRPDLNRTDDLKNYDRRIARWYYQQEIKCWYTLPSLVDHRPVGENPSLVKGRTGNRQAHEFIGVNESALDVDWKPDPVTSADYKELTV